MAANLLRAGHKDIRLTRSTGRVLDSLLRGTPVRWIGCAGDGALLSRWLLVAFLASLTSADYRKRGIKELARQRELSRTRVPWERVRGSTNTRADAVGEPKLHRLGATGRNSLPGAQLGSRSSARSAGRG